MLFWETFKSDEKVYILKQLDFCSMCSRVCNDKYTGRFWPYPCCYFMLDTALLNGGWYIWIHGMNKSNPSSQSIARKKERWPARFKRNRRFLRPLWKTFYFIFHSYFNFTSRIYYVWIVFSLESSTKGYPKLLVPLG